MLSLIDQYIEQLSSQVGFSPDQVRLVLCVLLPYPLGYLYQRLFPPQRTSPQARVRHLVSLLLGLLLGAFCYRGQMLIYFVSAVMSYVTMKVVSPKVVQLYMFAITMGWLSIVHIYRVSIDIGDSNYYNDVSGLGFCIYDGMGRKEDDLTNEQKEQCVRRLPTLLEFFSYSFNFPGFVLGPLCFYNDYVAFIEGKHSQAKDNTGVVQETNGLPSAMAKLVKGLTWLVVFSIISTWWPISRNGDPDFISSTPFHSRMLFAYVSLIGIRTKYYFAWTIGEGGNDAAGLGFNGFDEKNKERWDLNVNVMPLSTEFALSVRDALGYWNIQTSKWLRRISYERIPYYPLIFTNLFSAMWHGFYPIYYLTWPLFIMVVLSSRKVRKVVRPHFQHSTKMQRTYDLLTMISTIIAFVYITIPYTMLDFSAGIRYWKSLYFSGHLLLLLVLVLPLKEPNVSRKKEKDTTVQEKQQTLPNARGSYSPALKNGPISVKRS